MTNYPGDPGHSTSPLSYEVGWGRRGSAEGAYTTEGPEDQAGGKAQREKACVQGMLEEWKKERGWSFHPVLNAPQGSSLPVGGY